MYSRKVEHLYQLVLSALNVVSSERKQHDRASTTETEISRADAELQAALADDTPGLLLLDSVLDEDPTIDLDVEQEAVAFASSRAARTGLTFAPSLTSLISTLDESQSHSTFHVSSTRHLRPRGEYAPH